MNILDYVRSLLSPTGQSTRDWGNNLPPWTSQFSVPNRVDAMDCASESFINIVYMLTGFDASPRALAKLSGTNHSGNYMQTVLNAANKYGLIPYELWPTPDSFDWDSYYADIPQAILDQAVRVKAKFIPTDLNKSPLWTALVFSNGVGHAVAQINLNEYFDSETGAEVKPINYLGGVINYRTSLNIKLMIDCKTVRFADNKTFGIMIDTPNGTQIVKATGEDQWRSWHKPDSYGKPTVNPDGTTNWNVELQLNF